MAASNYRDYFKVLGLERNATSASIKRAFRKLARKHHPDVNPGNSQAEEQFKEINEAYEVLSDPEKRRRYEQFGQYWNQASGSGSNGSVNTEFDFGGYGNFDDFVNDLLGRFGGARGSSGFSGGFASSQGFPRNEPRSTLNLDAETTLQISFAEAFHGTTRTLSVNEERVQIQIPKGMKPGVRLRLKGKGNLQPGTGRRGDLYLNLSMKPHSIWRLEDDKLIANLPVSIDELALGAVITVMTPDGKAQLNIPSGTSPGKSLRLKGKGWPLEEGRGDLIFSLNMILPDHWSDEELLLFKQLQKIRFNDPRKSWLKSASL
jgi:curved DNA-binding protein